MTSTPTTPAPVERPHHVHPTRMRHISDIDLATALGRPGLDPHHLRAALAARDGHRPVWDPAAQARALVRSGRKAEVLAAATELLDRRVDFLSRGAGRSGLYGLHYLRWLEPLVHAYELTADERYAEGFGRLFDEWYASRDLVVGEWPGLDVVWYSLGVWARNMVLVPAATSFAASGIEDATCARMLKTIVGGARWAAEEHDAFRPGNWQLVCAAGLLHVAAFLPEAAEAPHWGAVGRARTIEHLDRDFYADGGHLERSPGYHLLCLEELQRAAVVAEQQLGWSLTDHPRFASAHRWLLSMTTPGGWVPSWQDSTLVRPAVALLRGSYFEPDPMVAACVRRWLTDDRIAAELEVLPPRPRRGDRPAGVPAAAADDLLPRAELLDSSGYAVMRGVQEFMAVNLGPYVEHELESHSHLAVTDFVIAHGGQPLALEAGGPPTYDDPGYQDWYRAPAAHNTVTVDGAAMSTARDCQVDRFVTAGDVCVLAAHHTGYPRRVDRRITFVGRDPAYWLVHDEVEDGAGATWSLLAPAPWQRVDGGYLSGRLGVFPAVPGLAASFDTGPGLIPGAAADGGGDGYGELHALRLHAPGGRFDVLVTPKAGDWRVTAEGDGWRVTAGEFVDVLRDDRWERRTRAGEPVAATVVPL